MLIDGKTSLKVIFNYFFDIFNKTINTNDSDSSLCYRVAIIVNILWILKFKSIPTSL